MTTQATITETAGEIVDVVLAHVGQGDPHQQVLALLVQRERNALLAGASAVIAVVDDFADRHAPIHNGDVIGNLNDLRAEVRARFLAIESASYGAGGAA